MPKPNAVHHLAVSTADMKAQIEFFTDVLGMQLVALYWMHGVEGAWHGFLRLNDSCSIAFVYTDANTSIQPVMGVSHSGSAATPSAPGTMQHLALNVDSMDEVLALRDRIRSKGLTVIGPVHHGFCSSIYFGGPENMSLEIATSGNVEHPLNPNLWIDPEVQALAGISDDELARYTAPADFAGQGGKVPQPALDPAKPHQLFPEEMLMMSDEEIDALLSETTPPGKAA